MDFLSQLPQYLLHIDEYLAQIIEMFGAWTYVILFLIIFAETGLVLAPFLPGDSLLFISGTLAGSGYLNILVLYVIFLVAAVLGDSVNYFIGSYIGPKAFKNPNSRIFKQEYLEKTIIFYEKHGGKTIILARFFPLLRTFAPFVAGIGHMHYKTFLFYNIIGGFIWVTLFLFLGYFFGSLPVVQEYFHIAIFGIIFLSLIPAAYEFIKHRRAPKKHGKSHATYKELEETFKKEHLSD